MSKQQTGALSAHSRETKKSLSELREHHRIHRPWGAHSDVIVQLCSEALSLMEERNEARALAERDQHDRLAALEATTHDVNLFPWQLQKCNVCDGDGRDEEHHHIEIVLDCDHIRCKLHGEVGHDRTHGMCDSCKGRGKIPSDEYKHLTLFQDREESSVLDSKVPPHKFVASRHGGANCGDCGAWSFAIQHQVD